MRAILARILVVVFLQLLVGQLPALELPGQSIYGEDIGWLSGQAVLKAAENSNRCFNDQFELSSEDPERRWASLDLSKAANPISLLLAEFGLTAAPAAALFEPVVLTHSVAPTEVEQWLTPGSTNFAISVVQDDATYVRRSADFLKDAVAGLTLPRQRALWVESIANECGAVLVTGFQVRRQTMIVLHPTAAQTVLLRGWEALGALVGPNYEWSSLSPFSTELWMRLIGLGPLEVAVLTVDEFGPNGIAATPKTLSTPDEVMLFVEEIEALAGQVSPHHSEVSVESIAEALPAELVAQDHVVPEPRVERVEEAVAAIDALYEAEKLVNVDLYHVQAGIHERSIYETLPSVLVDQLTEFSASLDSLAVDLGRVHGEANSAANTLEWASWYPQILPSNELFVYGFTGVPGREALWSEDVDYRRVRRVTGLPEIFDRRSLSWLGACVPLGDSQDTDRLAILRALINGVSNSSPTFNIPADAFSRLAFDLAQPDLSGPLFSAPLSTDPAVAWGTNDGLLKSDVLMTVETPSVISRFLQLGVTVDRNDDPDGGRLPNGMSAGNGVVLSAETVGEQDQSWQLFTLYVPCVTMTELTQNMISLTISEPEGSVIFEGMIDTRTFIPPNAEDLDDPIARSMVPMATDVLKRYLDTPPEWFLTAYYRLATIAGILPYINAAVQNYD